MLLLKNVLAFLRNAIFLKSLQPLNPRKKLKQF